VRLYLASAIQRVPQETAWELIDALAAHGEDRDDRNLPFLLWDGLAQRMTASRHPAAGHQSSAEDASPSPGRSPRPSDGRGDRGVWRLAERLAAVFGDDSIFARLREELSNASAEVESRKHAFAVLSRGPDRSSLPVLLKLLDDPAFRTSTISLLARLDGPEVS